MKVFIIFGAFEPLFDRTEKESKQNLECCIITSDTALLASVVKEEEKRKKRVRKPERLNKPIVGLSASRRVLISGVKSTPAKEATFFARFQGLHVSASQ